jgi:hypothetical protein
MNPLLFNIFRFRQVRPLFAPCLKTIEYEVREVFGTHLILSHIFLSTSTSVVQSQASADRSPSKAHQACSKVTLSQTT